MFFFFFFFFLPCGNDCNSSYSKLTMSTIAIDHFPCILVSMVTQEAKVKRSV